MHDHTDLAKAIGRLGADAPPSVARGLLLAMGRHAAGGQAPPLVPAAAVAPLLAAAREVAADLTADTSGLADLDDRWHGAVGQADADAIVAAPLALHLDALYAVEGIEALAEAVPGSRAEIEGVVLDLVMAFMAHDCGLRSHVGCLCTLADSAALKAWRRSLPEGMDPIPWWLDGSLEAEAAELALRTDALASRISATLGSRRAVGPVPDGTAAARAIRSAAGFTLAAASAVPAGLTSHSWRHPSLPIEAVLWVPSAFDEAADLRIVFRGSAAHEERGLVGEVMLLEGIPAVVTLYRDGGADRVEAVWPARAMAAVIRESVALSDGHGRRWMRGG